MTDDESRFSAEQELNDRILSSIKNNFSGEETKRWMTAIQEDKLTSAEEAISQGAKDNALSTSMSAVMDKLFDNFKRYSFDFNRTQDNRDFEVTCERPASMRMTAEYMEHGKPIKFCLGHLSTKTYALVIQGEEIRVRAFVVPVEYLVGFKPHQLEFSPYLDMKLAASRTMSESNWTIEGQTVAMSSLPALSRRLFTQLIKVSKGEANFDERFVFNPQEHDIPKPQNVDRSFEDESKDPLSTGENKSLSSFTEEFFQTEKAAEAPKPAPPPVLPAPATVAAAIANTSVDGTPMPISWQAAAARATAQATNSTNTATTLEPDVYKVPDSISANPATAQVSASTPNPAPVSAPAPEATPAPVALAQAAPPAAVQASPSAAPAAAETSVAPANTTANPNSHVFNAGASQEETAGGSTKGDGKIDTGEISRNVARSIKNLFDTVDTSISSLTQMGVDAMHADDIEKVGEIMRHTKTLKALREGIVQISKDWQKSL